MKKLSKSLTLIGFQGSGKTTFGQALALHFKSPFIDTDRLLEAFQPPLNCRQIFKEFGESYFRQLERNVISSIKFASPLIIATGGGSLLEEGNALFLKQQTQLVYLKTSPAILMRRMRQSESIPSFLEGKDPERAFMELYQQRILLYETWADQQIEMDHFTRDEALQKLIEMSRG